MPLTLSTRTNASKNFETMTTYMPVIPANLKDSSIIGQFQGFRSDSISSAHLISVCSDGLILVWLNGCNVHKCRR